MKRSLATIAVVACLALAGCSSTTAQPPATEPTTPIIETPSPAASPSPESPSPEAEDQTLESIADTAGVADFERSAEAAPATLAWGKGTIAGTVVRVYEFADEAGYQAFLQSVAGYGVTEDTLVHIGNFAIAPDDAELLEQIRDAVE